MNATKLTSIASDLESVLQQKIKFYLRVGWIREDSSDILIVYYDERELLPPKVVPDRWQGILVCTQGVLPPGVKPPEESSPFKWVW